jgi:SAM-dependent methyltransferase
MSQAAQPGEAKTAEARFDWEDHFRLIRDDPPKPMLLLALKSPVEKGKALDLGAGALNDARHLLKVGFQKVVALDANLPGHAASGFANTERFEFVKARMQDFAFPKAAFDLVNAQFVLPFLPPQDFPAVFASACDSLAPGGLFAGQLFGTNDEWASDPQMTFHDPAEARRLLARYGDFVYFSDEENWSGTLASGQTKHWHILHFIVRRRAG